MPILPRWIRNPVENHLRRQRQQKVFSFLDRNGHGLEIGPCHNGLAPKREGFDVCILDHLDQNGLRAKYKDQSNVDCELIETVDFVWSGETYNILTGSEKFDWVIASHVIEHVPDLVKFLQECSGILKENGRITLVIPDMRREFDLLRYPSGCGEVIDAHLRGDIRPSPGVVTEHFLRASTKGGRLAWPWWWLGKLRRIHTVEEVKHAAAASKERYTDVHVWRFTPSSFKMLIEDLQKSGYLKLKIVEQWASGSEFFVFLEREN